MYNVTILYILTYLNIFVYIRNGQSTAHVPHGFLDNFVAPEIYIMLLKNMFNFVE